MLNPGIILQNRYQIISTLGQGGMGCVYRAFDQTLNRAVAIKERIPDPNASPQGLAQARLQFQREAQTLAALSHPNLPHTYDYFSFGANEYVVMELIEGQPLDQIVAQHGAINEGAVRAWADQILDALTYIHSRNVIHRDIKPANIIVKPDGRAILVDFGLVKLVDPTNPRTATAMRGMGTAEYAPLEQFSPGMHTDTRSDIYSFGATLYHLLSGRAPLDVPQRLLNPAQQPALRALNPAISAPTESAVEKALEVYPQNRFQNAAEMRQALSAARRSQPPLPTQPVAAPPVPVATAPVYSVPTVAPITTTHGGNGDWIAWILGTIVLGAFFLLAFGRIAFSPTPTPAPTAAPPTRVAIVVPTQTSILRTAAPPTVASTVTTAPTPTSTSYLQTLYEAAKREGALSVIALPDDWINFVETKRTFLAKYPSIKLTDLDPQAGSSDEINAINANKDNKGPQNPDVVDVGIAFAPTLKDGGLCLPYKVANWDTIPTDLKDPDGCWYGDYYGVFSFAVNKSVIKNSPQDWADLLKPEYKSSIAIAGDPLISNQAQQSVYAAALANGGSLTNVQPGLDFFARLARSGNLVSMIGDQSKLARGETPILITWDYLALAYRDVLKGSPEIEVIVPKSLVFGAFYIQAINKYSPRPNAAKLWMEFLYSDEGQLIWLRGYGHPIRYNDLVRRNAVPADLARKLPPAELYAKTVFPSGTQIATARKYVADNWERVVGVKISR